MAAAVKGISCERHHSQQSALTCCTALQPCLSAAATGNLQSTCMQPSRHPVPCPRHDSPEGGSVGCAELHPSSLLTQLLCMLSRACHWLCPHPFYCRPAHTPVLPGSGASFTLAGPLLRMWLPQPSPKGWGESALVWSWWEPPVFLRHPNTLVLTKRGGYRQHRHYLHVACREQLEQNKHSSSLLPAPAPGHQPQGAQGALAMHTTVPACAVPSHCREVPGFVLLCPPSQGARRSYRDVQKFCLLP